MIGAIRPEPLFAILSLNGGSSTIRFALYQVGQPLKRRLYGRVDHLGLGGTNLTFSNPDVEPQASLRLTPADYKSAGGFLMNCLEEPRRRHPKLPQLACFDTASHCDMLAQAGVNVDSLPPNSRTTAQSRL